MTAPTDRRLVLISRVAEWAATASTARNRRRVDACIRSITAVAEGRDGDAARLLRNLVMNDGAGTGKASAPPSGREAAPRARPAGQVAPCPTQAPAARRGPESPAGDAGQA